VNPGVGSQNETGGYRVFDTIGAVIENNMVSNTTPQQGVVYGIHVLFSRGTVVSGNRVANMNVGILNREGGAIFVDNSVYGATQVIWSGGTLVGTTNVAF
jgi:hypothetical protein